MPGIGCEVLLKAGRGDLDFLTRKFDLYGCVVGMQRKKISTSGSIVKIEWLKDATGELTRVGLYLLTDGTVVRTDNGGLTMRILSAELNNDKIRGIEQTMDGSKVFLMTEGAWMWESVDAGETFMNRSTIGNYVHSLKLHPTLPEMILATTFTPCCLKSLACTTCESLLVVSANKGETWTTVTNYVYYRGSMSYSWIPLASGGTSHAAAFVAYADKSGDQRVKLGEAMNLHLMSDIRNPASVVQTVGHGGPFMWTNETAMMARISTGRPGLTNLMVSRDYGATWSRVEYPPVVNFDSLREWLPTESANPFLAVFNGPDYSNGHVFVSTGGSGDFTLTLRNLVNRLNQPHWTHLGNSIPGTYIANIHTDAQQLLVSTKISFNHGGHWHSLKLADDSRRSATKDTKDDDDDDTTVHLAAPFSGPQFHVSASSPGLVIASGQVGAHLTDWKGQALFISRDAGRNWKKTLDGSFVAFSSNGGSAILAIDQSTFSDTLHYSLDYGTTWSTCNFTTSPVRPISMRASFDDDLSPIVILDANNPTDGSFTIFTLNLTTVYDRICSSSDFENWPLLDSDDHNCILGHQYVFSRRIDTALCQKTRGQAKLQENSVCECSEEDFICPYCYERQNLNDDCDFLWDDCGGDVSTRPDSYSNCSDSYEIPKNEANAKSPESICVGGTSINDLDSDISCPPRSIIDSPPPPVSTLQNDFMVSVGAIALALCGIFIVGIFFACKNYIRGTPHVDIAAWKSVLRPATENDQRRETVRQGLEYQSDVDGLITVHVNDIGEPHNSVSMDEFEPRDGDEFSEDDDRFDHV